MSGVKRNPEIDQAVKQALGCSPPDCGYTRLLRMRAGGATGKQIAEAFGLHPTTTTKSIRDAIEWVAKGCQTLARPNKWTPYDASAALKVQSPKGNRSGRSVLREVSEANSEGKSSEWLRAAGCLLRHQSGRIAAQVLGIKPQSLYQIINRELRPSAGVSEKVDPTLAAHCKASQRLKPGYIGRLIRVEMDTPIFRFAESSGAVSVSISAPATSATGSPAPSIAARASRATAKKPCAPSCDNSAGHPRPARPLAGLEGGLKDSQDGCCEPR